MAYLTYDEYKNNYQLEPVDEEYFAKLLFRAELAIGQYTASYLTDKKFEDLSGHQQAKLKLATALMVDEIAITGKLRQSERENGVQSQTIGRTSVNYGTNRKAESLPADVLNVLRGTGLLLRGVPYVR
jgi:hypothetical protein